MRNEKLVELDALVGDWDLTLSGAWFLDSPEIEQHGRATFEWLGDAFVAMRSSMEGEPTWDLVFGRSDARERLYALYHDNRGMNRLFDMAFDGRTWTMRGKTPIFTSASSPTSSRIG